MLPHAIALGLVVKGKARTLHEAKDIVLCQIGDKASEHIRRSCDHKKSLDLIAHRWWATGDPPRRNLRACLLSVAFVARRSRAPPRSGVLGCLLARLVSLVGCAVWAGSMGRWVDTGANFRVHPPQIEAQCTAQDAEMY